MRLYEVLLIGIGLSMDAFAVSVCRGLATSKPTVKQYLAVALWFGGFQALMPVLGCLLGLEFGRRIDGVDHILACLILSLIGFNMIREGLSHDATATEPGAGKTGTVDKSGAVSLFLLAVATSIDAFAVGISFGVMGNVNIANAACLVGATTALLSGAGLKIGSLFGARSKNKAELVGGVLLVLIGVKILVEGFLK